MPTEIENLLKNVESRLGETLEAFAVMRELNENCNRDINPRMFQVINSRGGFWHPVLLGLQTTVITGINAILDKGRNDSATLYLIKNKLAQNLRRSIPPDLEQNLDTIRDRYKNFRHKLFGHNDINRDIVAEEFNRAGFTWDSLAEDLANLEHTLKVLWHAANGQHIPDKTETKTMLYPYSLSLLKTKEDSAALMTDLSTGSSIPIKTDAGR